MVQIKLRSFPGPFFTKNFDMDYANIQNNGNLKNPLYKKLKKVLTYLRSNDTSKCYLLFSKISSLHHSHITSNTNIIELF